jgi:hypothetical protein
MAQAPAVTKSGAVTKSSGNLLRFLARKSRLKAVLLSAVMAAVLVGRNTNDGPAWRVSLVLAALIAVGTWLVFGVATPRVIRRQRVSTSAWGTAVLAGFTLLSVGVFWTALTPIFAFGAFTLAADTQERRSPAPWPARLGSALAGIGLLTSLVLALIG